MQPVFAKFDHGKNAAEAGLEAEPVVRNMQHLLEKIVVQSVSVYK